MKSRSTAWLWVWFGVILPAFAAACGNDAPKDATLVKPTFDQPCRYAQCSDHGECAGEPDAGGPMCLCNVGYQGGRCTTCETGFHLDAKNRCAPDRSCAKQTSNPCGIHGDCDDSDGVIMCDCDPGYEGPRCTLCADGFGRDMYGDCLMLVIGPDGGAMLPPPLTGSGGNGGSTEPGGPAPALCNADSCNGNGTCDGKDGQIKCACAVGYAGDRCATCADQYRRDGSDKCVPYETCKTDSCGAHGSCDASSGVIACACSVGYDGDVCAACAPGFHDQSSTCTLDQECLTNTCAGHGTCAMTSGDIACTCESAYGGSNCEKCATGYHRDATDACMVNQTCGANDCKPHGTCDATTGVIVCKCNDGYSGDTCNACAPGFHDGGDAGCALNQQCQPTTCAPHATCDESTGSVHCHCQVGYAGDTCASCDVGYYRDHKTDTCVVFDCHNNPIGAAGKVDFEAVLGFPQYMNTCNSGADLSTNDVQFSSISGDGTVWACAPSDIYGIASRHVMLEAGIMGPAAIFFSGPIGSLNFDYGAKTALSLDVLADGVVVRTLTATRKSSATLTFTFTAPITEFALRASGTTTNQIGLDNIAYAPPACP